VLHAVSVGEPTIASTHAPAAILIILGPEQRPKGPNPNDGEESHITLQREFGPMLNESWYYTKTPPVAANKTSDEDKLEQSTSSRSP
jgi:hypothetical protein